MAPTPYERIDALEREVRHLTTQVLLLATALGHQATTIAGLMRQLGIESLEEVVDASPAPSAQRPGRKAH